MEKKSKVTTLPTAPKEDAQKMIPVSEANAQMQNVVKQANVKIQQLAMQCNELEGMLRDKTVENLFRVLKYSVPFNKDFVEKSAKTIEEYITKVAFTTETPEQSVQENKEEVNTEKAE